MKVVADAACWANRRGFGRFTRELLSAMARRAQGRELILLVDALSADEAEPPQGARVQPVAVDARPIDAASAKGSRSLRDIWRFRRAAARLRPDALFFPAVYSYFPVPGRVRSVVTFHDAIADNRPAEVFPDRRGRALWALKVRLALRQADRIVTVSDYSRRQVARTFRLEPETIAVIGEGVSADFRPVDDAGVLGAALARAGLAPGDRYLLYVGGLSPHKNLERLVAALAELRGRDQAVPLVICGDDKGDAFHSSAEAVKRLVRTLGLDELVRFSGFVPDAELPALYSGATAVVLPSLDEGFGLPAAEAMACGAPVAAARAGGLPETLGDAGAYFDPHDSGSIAGALVRLLQSEQEREELRRRGLARAIRFRWDEAADRAWLVLSDVVGGARAS